ncbi:hypothetical protein NJ75_02054 [Novosphingobium subterraneum]|uniref:Uncharacterized protein n=1 Tax=Novosphingobium subterraneum TaxID=48936 RepID=A0A0B8ZUJ6_9SPHN|nr:hypothetical protein NJ75_02054 [Novosphingobium subterraneum]
MEWLVRIIGIGLLALGALFVIGGTISYLLNVVFH